jgi:hypothetical protein
MVIEFDFGSGAGVAAAKKEETRRGREKYPQLFFKGGAPAAVVVAFRFARVILWPWARQILKRGQDPSRSSCTTVMKFIRLFFFNYFYLFSFFACFEKKSEKNGKNRNF